MTMMMTMMMMMMMTMIIKLFFLPYHTARFENAPLPFSSLSRDSPRGYITYRFVQKI
jgi:hypothetical protein